MQYAIKHWTRYRYSRPVFLEPHTVRLRPRCEPAQALLHWSLEVNPVPAGRCDSIDAEGNPFTLLWFNDLHDALELRVESQVETLRANPFDSLLVDGAERLGFAWNAARPELAPYLPELETGTEDPEESRDLLTAMVQELRRESDGDTLYFLFILNQRLYGDIEQIVREEPGIQPVEQTLADGRGACRDLAVAFIAACRSVGIPARFVSGYQEGDPGQTHRDLHAWAEVYLPGFGWRGYDPSQGLVVADRHVVLAAAASPENTAPLAGTFRGTAARSQLDHHIEIKVK